MVSQATALADLVVAFTDAFNANDLDAVMGYFADDCLYDQHDGSLAVGRPAVRAAFAPQFAGAFGTMRFETEDLFVDQAAGKVLIRWLCVLDKDGRRRGWRGLDIIHVVAGRISEKHTYAKAERLKLSDLAAQSG